MVKLVLLQSFLNHFLVLKTMKLPVTEEQTIMAEIELTVKGHFLLIQ